MCYCAKISMHSMLMLGSLGACPPGKFENRCSEIESEGILESIYLALQCVLTCKINVKRTVIFLYVSLTI